MSKPKPPTVDERQVCSLLQRYKCSVPYHAVRTRFLGNIATPAMAASPMYTLKSLWGGDLPSFESMEAANELIGLLVNGLWNSLTLHQKRTEPFRLVRSPIEPSRAGLIDYSLMRLQEIDGFVEGLFNGEADMELPEKVSVSLGIIGELRAILAGLHALALDETKAGSDQEFVATLKQVQAFTPIIEREIHVVVLACTRARRQTLQAQDFSGPMVH